MAAPPPHQPRSERLRPRVPGALHHLDDAGPCRSPVRAPPRAVGRRRGGAPDRAAFRDPRRSRRRSPHPRGTLCPARLSRASGDVRRRADDHDRILGQQQGRRLPVGELDALPRAGVDRARVRGPSGGAHHLPRAGRAIRAQPAGTVRGRFRVTEQGETIASRYADAELARRHLHQIVSAVLLTSASPESRDEVPGPWALAMQRMAAAARHAYLDLVERTPGFLDYWRTATPIDEISRLRLGSRPAARRGGALTRSGVRAIPWVFSWMQSRFNLPGWYGLGAALEVGEPERLRRMFREWPFFRALLDNAEMSLLKADLGIAALYSALVPDQT